MLWDILQTIQIDPSQYILSRDNFTRRPPRYKVRGNKAAIEIMRPIPVSPSVIAAALSACAFEPESLNSERIEERFGSYGVEVLSHKAGVRRSSMYSVAGDTRVCRTYAVVRFEDEATLRVSEAHASVLAGESIGVTFKSTGWQIRKATLHLGSILLNASSHPIGKLMHLDGDVDLGIHAYRLVLEKGSQSVDYATIVEAHHPEYLPAVELKDLHGDSKGINLDDLDISNLETLVLETD